MQEGSQPKHRETPGLDRPATVRAEPGVVGDPATVQLGEPAADGIDRRPSSEVAALARFAGDDCQIGAAKRRARPKEQRFGGASRDAQSRGDLLVAQAVHVLEHEDGAVVHGEAGQRLLEHPAELRLLEGVDPRRADLLRRIGGDGVSLA